jgi:serine/threonine protein kinase
MLCDHPNIVKVLGVCIDEEFNAHLMLEYADEGDLSSFL